MNNKSYNGPNYIKSSMVLYDEELSVTHSLVLSYDLIIQELKLESNLKTNNYYSTVYNKSNMINFKYDINNNKLLEIVDYNKGKNQFLFEVTVNKLEENQMQNSYINLKFYTSSKLDYFKWIRMLNLHFNCKDIANDNTNFNHQEFLTQINSKEKRLSNAKLTSNEIQSENSSDLEQFMNKTRFTKNSKSKGKQINNSEYNSNSSNKLIASSYGKIKIDANELKKLETTKPNSNIENNNNNFEYNLLKVDNDFSNNIKVSVFDDISKLKKGYQISVIEDNRDGFDKVRKIEQSSGVVNFSFYDHDESKQSITPLKKEFEKNNEKLISRYNNRVITFNTENDENEKKELVHIRKNNVVSEQSSIIAEENNLLNKNIKEKFITDSLTMNLPSQESYNEKTKTKYIDDDINNILNSITLDDGKFIAKTPEVHQKSNQSKKEAEGNIEVEPISSSVYLKKPKPHKFAKKMSNDLNQNTQIKENFIYEKYEEAISNTKEDHLKSNKIDKYKTPITTTTESVKPSKSFDFNSKLMNIEEVTSNENTEINSIEQINFVNIGGNFEMSNDNLVNELEKRKKYVNINFDAFNKDLFDKFNHTETKNLISNSINFNTKGTQIINNKKALFKELKNENKIREKQKLDGTLINIYEDGLIREGRQLKNTHVDQINFKEKIGIRNINMNELKYNYDLPLEDRDQEKVKLAPEKHVLKNLRENEKYSAENLKAKEISELTILEDIKKEEFNINFDEKTNFFHSNALAHAQPIGLKIYKQREKTPTKSFSEIKNTMPSEELVGKFKEFEKNIDIEKLDQSYLPKEYQNLVKNRYINEINEINEQKQKQMKIDEEKRRNEETANFLEQQRLEALKQKNFKQSKKEWENTCTQNWEIEEKYNNPSFFNKDSINMPHRVESSKETTIRVFDKTDPLIDAELMHIRTSGKSKFIELESIGIMNSKQQKNNYNLNENKVLSETFNFKSQIQSANDKLEQLYIKNQVNDITNLNIENTQNKGFKFQNDKSYINNQTIANNITVNQSIFINNKKPKITKPIAASENEINILNQQGKVERYLNSEDLAWRDMKDNYHINIHHTYKDQKNEITAVRDEMHLPLGQKLKDVNYLNEKVKQKEKEFSVLQEKSMIKDDKKLNKKEDKLAIQLKKEVKSIQQVQQSNHILQDKKFNLNGLEELTAKSNINKNFVHQDTSISNISLLNYSKLEVDEMWEDGFEENFELGNNLSIEY